MRKVSAKTVAQILFYNQMHRRLDASRQLAEENELWAQ
jgi:hypothetical protein